MSTEDFDKSPPPPTPAGWYADAKDAEVMRYWDGSRWTDRTKTSQSESDTQGPGQKDDGLPRHGATSEPGGSTPDSENLAAEATSPNISAPSRKRLLIGGVVAAALGVIALIGVAAVEISLTIASVEAGPADTTSPAPAPSAESASPTAVRAQELQVVELAFGRDGTSDRWWYAIVVNNPNDEFIFDNAGIDVEALDADGVILDSDSNYTVLLHGQTVLVGTFRSIGSFAISDLSVRGPTASSAIRMPAAEVGSMSTSDITTVTERRFTEVSGTVTSSFDSDQEFVLVSVIARDPSGIIVGSDAAFIERLPAGGAARFESSFWENVQPDWVFEAYANL